MLRSSSPLCSPLDPSPIHGPGPGLGQIKQADNFLSKLYNNLMSLHNFTTTESEQESVSHFCGGATDKKKARKLGPKASQLDNDDDDYDGKSHYSVY